jgi:hypothetical protein
MKDQLVREMEKGDVFSGFSEQPISFPPTYKFNVNSDEYDTSEKQRTQSWTVSSDAVSRLACVVSKNLWLI